MTDDELARLLGLKPIVDLDLPVRRGCCEPPPCPPVEEVEVFAIVPAHVYVPGTFAREVAEFYAEHDDD